MAKGSNDLRVHLDHLILRESLRWVEPKADQEGGASTSRSPAAKLAYKDLDDREHNTIFALLRKPDFQRETSAWTPEDCISLLESVVNGLIIPSLIVWNSPENNYLYVLDGAHRVSVMRAWILDDWGDKAPADYYERHEFAEEIKDAAQRTRELVRAKFGLYDDFVDAGNRYLKLAGEGASPKEGLSAGDFKRGKFFTQILKDAGFFIQEVSGNYKVAEASFLKINRSGQPLYDWETTLIENRNSSLARAVMSIASSGSGRFWPEEVGDPALKARLDEIQGYSQTLHKWMFVPPFSNPIRDVNVPFIATAKYFPKHAYLMEFLPVIKQVGDVDKLFSLDRDTDDAATIINNGHNLLSLSRTAMAHLTGPSDDPTSLALVPLFYFYTQAGRYVRSSLYGFVAWLTSGNSQEILRRKIIFSAHRGRFEKVVFGHDMPGAITRRVGSGLRATQANVEFYQKLVELLMADGSDIDSAEFQEKLKGILAKLTAPRLGKAAKEGRKFDDSQKTTINLRELFKSSLRCEICGGIMDLRLGVQYDHITKYSDSRITTSEDGRPTHPFCNNQRDAIEGYLKKTRKMSLPALAGGPFGSTEGVYQPSLFDLFNTTAFPDESTPS